SGAAAARDDVEAELNPQQQAYHGESLAMSSQQRRCHDLELELAQLRQAADVADKRRAAIAEELSALSAEEAAEREAREAIDADLGAGRGRLADAMRARNAGEEARSAARDRKEALAAELRAGEEARLSVEHKLEPARAKIEDMRLKQQAAVLAEQQFIDQLAEAHADLGTLPELLKVWGRASALPGEIERLTQANADLDAVNLAALDELRQAAERKQYLDAQAQDLTEAMATLETAIRQIDRES